MKRSKVVIATLASTLLTVNLAFADPVMTVIASSAPNFLNFSSFSDYSDNALNSIENGLGNIGDRNFDPTAYEQYMDGERVSVFEVIVSSFNSWRGVADPTAPFDGEFGNRLHFGLHVLWDGATQFRLEDLLFDISSSDGLLDFNGDFVGLDYNAFRVGIDWGADRMKGGGDDSIITSGAATQFIDELIYVGVGNAYDASGFPGATNQDKINAVPASLDFSIDVTGLYTLNDSGGNFLASGSTTLTIVPEPAAMTVLFGASVTCLLRRRR